MKFFLLLFLFVPFSAYCQHGNPQVPYANSMGRVDGIVTVDGRPFFPKQYVDVNGSPNMFDDFIPSKIILNDGKVIDNIRTNFNLVTSELLYLDETGKTMVASASTVKSVEIGVRRFITTPAKNTYFEILSTEGKAMLVRYTKKVIMETKPYNSATVQKDFRTNESHLLVIDDNLTEVKSLKNIFEVLPSTDHLKEFAKKEKLKQKSVDSWVKIVDYYNSI